MDKTDRTERKNHSNAGAVVRIVIWLVVLCLLGSLFAVCLMGHFGGGEIDGWFPQMPNLGFSNSYWYDDSDCSVGDHAFTERITSLDIDWLAGSVTIVPGEGDTLTIQEQSSKGDTDTRDQLRWRVADGKLTVKFCEPSRLLAFHISEKSLTVTVPAAWLEDMTSVKLDTASASVQVSGLRADRLDVDTASGAVTVTDLSIVIASFLFIILILKKEIKEMQIICIKNVKSVLFSALHRQGIRDIVYLNKNKWRDFHEI